MRRRTFLKTSAFLAVALVGCKNNPLKKEGHTHYLEADLGRDITLDGEIIHVCPVDGLKMKLKLADGEIIRVTSPDDSPFSKEWNHKKIRVSGKLDSTKLPREVINANKKDKKILCHIDHTPCYDEEWINNKWKNGSAESLLERDHRKLEMKMRETKQNYIQVFSITASEIEEA